MRKKAFVLLAILASSFATTRVFANNWVDGNGPMSGYKGFMETGYKFGVGEYGEDCFSFMTTHGYQFSPYYFGGIGVGVNYYDTQYGAWSVPIYGDVKAYLLNNSITPFIDLKIGYTLGDMEGFYLSPSMGCRIRTGNITAFYASFGYEMQKVKVSNYMQVKTKYGSYRKEIGWNNETCGGLCLKVGFEF